jgi:hypothetical protein
MELCYDPILNGNKGRQRAEVRHASGVSLHRRNRSHTTSGSSPDSHIQYFSRRGSPLTEVKAGFLAPLLALPGPLPSADLYLQQDDLHDTLSRARYPAIGNSTRREHSYRVPVF